MISLLCTKLYLLMNSYIINCRYKYEVFIQLNGVHIPLLTEMSLEEQEMFFQKVLKVLRKKFPHMIILSAYVHHDEIFLPLDDEMKKLIPEEKVTPHMHVIAIPVFHDKNIPFH